MVAGYWHASQAAPAVAFSEYTVFVSASKIAIDPSANFASAKVPD